jgi:hypothetical protein
MWRRAELRATLSVLLVSALALGLAGVARAGTYPMHQCTGSAGVSPGWTAYGFTTLASTVLSDECGAGGRLGLYAFTNGQAGAVTENGSTGSQVGLELAVPASAPGVSIQAIAGQVTASSVTGDDAFLGFASAGQALPGLVELPFGGGDYSAGESWSLPQGARDFEAFVNCSTDHSSPTCQFADSRAIPALSGLTLTLAESTPPSIGSVSGPLASAAASGSSVSGSQAISFTLGDADSGVRSAVLTLSPQTGGAPSVHSLDFSSSCTYDAWSACANTQTGSGLTMNTTSLANGAYVVGLSVTDAAGNTSNDALGTVAVSNSPSGTSPLGALPGSGLGESALALGAPNGLGASASAQLHLSASGTLRRPYAQRALRLGGRLLGRDGAPIAGATLALMQTVAGTARQEVLANVTTAPDGTFTVAVPPGPSRTIGLAYRAFAAASGYAATASVREVVAAGVQLSVRPRRIAAEGKITLAGTVWGPVPARGAIVDLLVHYRGRWEPFRTPRTDAHGRFRVEYQFQGAVGRFPFKAEVPAGQAGFPFGGGASKVVSVAAR